MSRVRLGFVAAWFACVCAIGASHAQQPDRPPIASTKVDGTDDVCVFRSGNYQAMFIVTADGVIDFSALEAEAFIEQALAMDWERLIPGHPRPGDRLGTKKDVQHRLTLLRAASAEMKKLAQKGKCWDAAEKEFTLSGYENRPGYANNLAFVARRDCGLRGLGT